jgi:hypothetical protein
MMRDLSPACSPSRPSWLLLILVSLGACGSESGSPTLESDVGPIIDVRVVPAEVGSGLEPVVFEGETLQLEPASLITDSDLVYVEPSVGDSDLLLHLELRPEAAERMGARTRDEIGGRLAIFVDGQLREAPEIVSAVGSTRVSMGFPATEEEALRISDLIRSRWPSTSPEPR